MATIKYHKVTALPGTLEADALYFVQNGTFCETYLTNAAGVARSIGNSAMIQSIADQRITSALADLNLVEIVADIASRNALSTARNQMALVLDATGDTSVTSGAALYAFREATGTWIKVAEYEGLDVTLTWNAISGRPASSPTLIDDAVTKRHSHANQAQLDKIGEAGGQMTYDGQTLGGAAWSTNTW